MSAEIIAVGSELLLGQIVNTNAAFFAQELAALGIDCHFQTVVGDNKRRLKNALQVAFQRADLVLTSGGLGPTSDDLTIETCAEFFGEELFLDEAVFRHIQELFAKRQQPMAPSNAKQALRPLSARCLPNPVGTAPGIIWEVTEYCRRLGLGEPNGSPKKLLITFPGVPAELKAMWRETVQPLLRASYAEQSIISRQLKFFGIGESALAERVQDLLEQADPTVAPLASTGECCLRLTTKVISGEENLAQGRLFRTEEEIRRRVGEYCYGVDEDTLEGVLVRKCRAVKKTISLAESCTGGLLSQMVTGVPGSSAVLNLGVVAYANQAKQQVLEVQASSLKSSGAVSARVAEEMAVGIGKVSQSDFGLSITGIAGPDGGSSSKPVGLVFIGLYDKARQQVQVRKFSFGPQPREIIRLRSCKEALHWLIGELAA